jgi:hypothetical protein
VYSRRVRVVFRSLLMGLIVPVTLVPQQLDFAAAEREIVRLAPSAFPKLPGAVVHELQRRGCTVPQEVFSKSPNNFMSGHFASREQTDWAVLCSSHGNSSILVFWNGSANNPAELARSEDKNYLQGLGGSKIGFSRGMGVVGGDFIRKHYEAYGGPKPPPIDHQGIDDIFMEKASVVHYFFRGKWLRLSGSD